MLWSDIIHKQADSGFGTSKSKLAGCRVAGLPLQAGMSMQASTLALSLGFIQGLGMLHSRRHL